MKQLNRIFYIYSEASGAVFMAFSALVEFACGLAIGGDIQLWIANPAAGFFASVALLGVLHIIRSERIYA